MDFLLYEGKVAVVLLVFYLFYRFLLKKETFHRFNRVVLVGTVLISFLLPLCVITIHRTVGINATVPEPILNTAGGMSIVVEDGAPWWLDALAILFWAGAAAVLIRIALSIFSIEKIVRNGEVMLNEAGCKVIVTERNIEPFSWMQYIVLSKTDWESNCSPILAHERAHIKYKHSLELLLVDVLSAFQWFNPTIWMLRYDLQELHEYEADNSVLLGGADIKEYQYLLLRKAVRKGGYSVANNLNHSTLKNRIAMMSKAKSPLSRGLRALYMLPLVCLCIGLQAQTVEEPEIKVIGTSQDNPIKIFTSLESVPLFILRQVWGEEKEITREELENIEPHRIDNMEILKDKSAIEKYGEKAADGVVIITLKRPQELDEIVVVSYKNEEEDAQFYLVEPDTMPSFQGEGMQGFSMWLNKRIVRPKGCNHVGRMLVSFVVDTDGAVKDVKVLEGICEELDGHIVSLVKQSPDWEPATVNGKPEPQALTIPITFQMR